MAWQPIETAPKDGSCIVCWAPSFDGPCFLTWKTNPRTGLSYFGDVVEQDDYELGTDGPTHWYPIEPPPSQEVLA